MDGTSFNVPITTDEVLAGLDNRTVFELERDHGNTDLTRAIEAAQGAAKGGYVVVVKTLWRLAPEGYQVQAFDASPKMVEAATKREGVS